MYLSIIETNKHSKWYQRKAFAIISITAKLTGHKKTLLFLNEAGAFLFYILSKNFFKDFCNLACRGFAL